MAIRYDKDFNAEIRRIVQNFNSKVDRLERQEQEIIPDKVTVKELKTIYQDRRQLKRRLRQLQSFSRRGAENVITTPGGVEMTEWQYETGRADYIMVKRRLIQQVKNETPKAPSPYLKNERLQNAEDRLSEMQKAFKELTLQDLKNVQKTINLEIEKRFKENLFKENLIKRIGGTLESRGYSPDIIKRLSKFSGEQLLQIYNNEQELQDVMDFGDTLGNNDPDVKDRLGNVSISSSQFDKIVNKMITRLPLYEKTYL